MSTFSSNLEAIFAGDFGAEDGRLNWWKKFQGSSVCILCHEYFWGLLARFIMNIRSKEPAENVFSFVRKLVSLKSAQDLA